MIKRYIVLFLIGSHFASRPETQTIQADRVSGALLGSAIGDAFGQVTSSFQSYKCLVAEYGQEGICSLSQLKEEDWFTDATGSKKLPFSRNTMISSASCSLLGLMRQKGTTKEEFAYQMAQSLLCFYGEENIVWDAHFAHWLKANKWPLKEEDVPQMTQCYYWMAQGGDNRIHYCYHNQADADALYRAWPAAIVYADNVNEARKCADYLTMMTHAHPTARAATAAYVTGLAVLLNGGTVKDAIEQMIREAEKFDSIELLAKKSAVKITDESAFRPDLVANERLLTSDLIRYAVFLAQAGRSPVEVFGANAKKQENNRSFRGYLLGYQADEAVAAAVYLLARNQQNIKKIIAEGSLASGNTALITSLATALAGAHVGFDIMVKEDLNAVITALENSDKLVALPKVIIECHDMPVVSFGPDLKNVSNEDAAQYYNLTTNESIGWKTFKRIFLAGGLALGAYYLWSQS